MGFVEILTIFFSTLLRATARNAFAPAAVASPLSDNSRQGNTSQSQSAGAVRGRQALSPPIIGNSQFVKLLGFQQSHLVVFSDVSGLPNALLWCKLKTDLNNYSP